MNSEELELSLRTEFENYLKNALADMKQEVSDFQEKFEAELDQHKANLDNVFKDFSGKIKEDKELEDSFTETVAEHLKLARDEGARITATAIAEAEELEKEQAPPAVNFSDLRDAIDEISSKDSQSEILKSLVHHASQYTPRGSFFIVKNEHLVGWRVFGTQEHENPHSIREVFFPVATQTSLGESIKSLATVESSYGSYENDSIYLNQLEFGQPEKMYAIPLIARGRGVAVLYADAGTDGDSVNVEALESLVRVAGLTVEVLASTKGAKPQHEQREEYQAEEVQEVEEQEAENVETEAPETYSFADTGAETSDISEEVPESYSLEDYTPVTEEPAEESYSPDAEEASEKESYSYQDSFETEPAQEFQAEPEVEEAQEEAEVAEEEYFAPQEDSVEEVEVAEEEATYEYDFQPAEEEVSEEVSEEPQPSYNDYSWDQSSESAEEVQEFSDGSKVEETSSVEDEYSVPAVEDYQAEPVESYEAESPVEFEDSTEEVKAPETDYQEQPAEYEFEAPVSEEYTDNEYTAVDESPAEESVEVAEEVSEEPAPAETSPAASVRPRFGDRNVDLPIEVAEDERRLHNDARRFARLLVSEIKLYNEQKVKEGRESSDLYERLREAIDRSREMYDKRVQPPVAAKFDYFHYELVNTLAEGEEGKLGGSYPGAAI